MRHYTSLIVGCIITLSVVSCRITDADAKVNVVEHLQNAPTPPQTGITGEELERLYRNIQSVETTPAR